MTDPIPGGQSAAYVDLHSHTTASDGSFSPQELVAEAGRANLQALAVTDHDTFAGFDEAETYARSAGLDLVCGIELNSKLELPTGSTRSVHVLAYFLKDKPAPPFRDWLEEQRLDRRDRNCRLIQALQAKGIEITIEEVERLGRSLTGRPHFARVLVAKGYATDSDDAFRRYIGETAPAYVERQSPSSAAVIAAIRSAGGVPVVAHPIRLDLDRVTEAAVLIKLKEAGLLGLEVYHSDQGPELQAHYARLAADLGLTPTGGSDFHGSVKPDIRLGTGRRNNVRVPASVLAALRALPNHENDVHNSDIRS